MTRSPDSPATGIAAPRPAADGAADAPVLFDAVLTPYRSLPPAGFAILMALVGAVGFMGGVAFLAIGAWPVTGFGAVEVGLFYILFRLNYRSARQFERVRLTRELLTVERHDVRGRVQRWSFQPYWLRVQLDEPIESDTPLTLRSHGKALVIGRFLSPAERLDFANALKAALAAMRAGPAQPCTE
jgi:uncharacterized membrane protein